MNILSKLIELILIQFRVTYLGFVQGHSYFTDDIVKETKQYLDTPDPNIVVQFEKEFAALVGDGDGVSFAAGRMALYALLRVLNVGKDDEVIVTGFTCSVVLNAILRTGARPIYTDIDIETYGSDPVSIERNISLRTKLIIAQHSFGIPCKIEEIITVAKKYNIPVVEDCALTLGSTSNGISVGNFGVAAFFSTDHSKPINTLIGGFLYTNDEALYTKIRSYHNDLPDLSLQHQQGLFNRFLYEKKYFTPTLYKRTKLHSLIEKTIRFFYSTYYEMLLIDDTRNPDKYPHDRYQYPAKLPTFLAYIGLHEIKCWEKEQKKRKEFLKAYLRSIIQYYSKDSYRIPEAYLNQRYDIIPLRFVFECTNSDIIKRKLKKVIDSNWIWFQKPIVATEAPLEEFYYRSGSCKIAESVGKRIVNLPCCFSINEIQLFFS